MYYKLNKGLLLRGWKRAPYALVDKNRHKTFFITGAEMKTLELCSGKIVHCLSSKTVVVC